ncbi:MAG: DoxX family protein [Armatimonadota bacterium]
MLALLRTSTGWAPVLIRLALGVVFIAHGGQKLFGLFGGQGWAATAESFGRMGIPAPLTALAAVAEFFGGLGVLVGLLTRIAAFGIACVMLVATLKVHLAHGFFLQNQGYEYTFALLCAAVSLMVSGGGAISLDGWISRFASRRAG